MFTGTYDHNIDEKYRITFPVRFREQVGEGAYIMSWFDGNLVVMPANRYNAFSDAVSSLPSGDPDARELQRFVFGSSEPIEFDKSGRFIIPANLREYAHLEGEATVIGSGNKIEIWSPVLLKERNERLKAPNAAAELVSKFNITF